MIKGTYVFYQDGKEIMRSDNLITKFGKRFLTSFLAGTVPFSSKDIAIGIAGESDYSVSDTNSRLGFEFYRLPVNFGSIDIQTVDSVSTYAVVYKTTLPQDIAGTIKEIGLYPGTRTSINSFDSKLITTFEDNFSWYDSISTNPSIVTSPAGLVGTTMLEFRFIGGTIDASREFKNNISSLDLSGYSVNDTLTLSYHKADTNLASIKIKFYSSETDYYYADITPESGTGYKIQDVSFSTILSSYENNPNLNAINKIGIEITRTNTSNSSIVYMDALRINDEDTFDPSFGLISRSILDTPLVKLAGRPVDIEYRLSMDF